MNISIDFHCKGNKRLRKFYCNTFWTVISLWWIEIFYWKYIFSFLFTWKWNGIQHSGRLEWKFHIIDYYFHIYLCNTFIILIRQHNVCNLYEYIIIFAKYDCLPFQINSFVLLLGKLGLMTWEVLSKLFLELVSCLLYTREEIFTECYAIQKHFYTWIYLWNQPCSCKRVRGKNHPVSISIYVYTVKLTTQTDRICTFMYANIA